MSQNQLGSPQRQGVAPTNTVHAARDVVAVACKMPTGLILRGYDPHQEVEVIPNGTRDVTVYRENGEQVVLGGTTARFGSPQPILTTGGYRITPNVPKKLWDNWYEANKSSDLVKNHIVYAHEDADQAAEFARKHDYVLTGLEGIDPDNPGKRVRGIERNDRAK